VQIQSVSPSGLNGNSIAYQQKNPQCFSVLGSWKEQDFLGMYYFSQGYISPWPLVCLNWLMHNLRNNIVAISSRHSPEIKHTPKT